MALGLVVSDKKILSSFPYISPCKTFDPQVGPFLPQWYNLNKLGRGLLGDATYQISKLYYLLVSEKKIFKVFISKIYF